MDWCEATVLKLNDTFLKLIQKHCSLRFCPQGRTFSSGVANVILLLIHKYHKKKIIYFPDVESTYKCFKLKRNTAEQHYVYCVTFLRNKIIFHMFALKSLYRSFFCVLLSYSKKKKKSHDSQTRGRATNGCKSCSFHVIWCFFHDYVRKFHPFMLHTKGQN